MFSPALEVILTVAYREAAARHHTHLTLEHLLYALAHDPDGERILAACGADLPQLRRDLDKYLDEHIEQFQRVTAPVYNEFPKWTPGLHDRVKKILGY